MFPEFLIIGAQKAGTTWLQRNLQTHPGIWMPKEKELHYFDEKIKLEGGPIRRMRGDKPPDKRWRRQARTRFRQSPRQLNLGDVAWDLKYFLGRPNDRWYASLFEPGRGKITGETTPDYAVIDRDTVAHVREIMPEAKIVFMMRSPIERPWSAMDMAVRTSGRSWDNVKERAIFRRLSKGPARLRTDYLATLENWGAFYPPEQIFVGFLEDVHFFPGELMERLYEFLGADPSLTPVITRKIHSGLRDTIPTRFVSYLADSYHDDIKRLADRFGGYASFWLYGAERLIEDPPDEEGIPYPLYESYLWDEWSEGRALAAQSGPLASARAAS